MKIFEISIFWVHFWPTYYGLMYVLWFIIWYWIIKKRWCIKNHLLDNLLFTIFLWVVLGWRLWYTLFYNFDYYSKNIWEIFKIWEWWMSFHGGVLWVIIAMIIFSKMNKINFYRLADEVTYVLPFGLFFWRIWNYINKELVWYEWYTGIFAIHINGESYFPSALLESWLEWILLFIILYFINKHKSFDWQIASSFLMWYGAFRMFVEYFFRTPDAHIWYILGNFSIGFFLSLPMFIIWIGYYIYLMKSWHVLWK